MTIANYIIDFVLANFWLIFYAILFVLVTSSFVIPLIEDRRKKKYDELEDLKRFVWDDYNLFKNQHNYSENRTLRLFFSNKTIYERAKELKIEHEWECDYYNRPRCSEESLREKRLYSYKYEKVVYEIYGEWGYRLSEDVWFVHKKLSPNYVVNEIARLLRINLADSIKLFDEFIQNGLIQYTDHNKWECILGYTLHNWDLISTDDYSFSKWKKNSVFYLKPTSTLDEFNNVFGNYVIVNSGDRWLMEYEMISKEKLHIKIEDEFLIREIEGNPKDFVTCYSFGKDNSEEMKHKICTYISGHKDTLYISNDVYNGYTLNFKRSPICNK